MVSKIGLKKSQNKLSDKSLIKSNYLNLSPFFLHSFNKYCYFAIFIQERKYYDCKSK